MEFGGFLHLILLEQLENVDERDRQNVQRRMLRDASDPFQLRDDEFITYFRLSKDTVFFLCDRLRHFLQPQRASGIPAELKILSALAFFGHGSYQKCVGQNLMMPMHQSSISRSIAEVSDAMVNHMFAEFVNFPQTYREQDAVKASFFQKFNIPGVIGAIDCTHVAIVAPAAEDHVRPGIAYYNRKGFYSLNVQMICDSDLKIMECNARFPGSTHDSAIWNLSGVKRYLAGIFRENEMRSNWLLGDSGYPLEPWLLTPVQDAADDSPESRFNIAHILARNCIERAFGVLKQRFRCLLRHRTLHYDPTKAGKIVYSCVILHNLAIARNDPPPYDPMEDEGEGDRGENYDGADAEINLLIAGRRRRAELINRFFR